MKASVIHTKADSLTPTKIRVNWSPKKGRIIVARCDIEKAELIELSPASEIPVSQLSVLNNTDLFEYYFVNPVHYASSEQCVEDDGQIGGYIPYGLVSLCSHSWSPNATVKWVQDDMGTWSELVSLERIPEGEEVEIYYTNIADYQNVEEFV